MVLYTYIATLVRYPYKIIFHTKYLINFIFPLSHLLRIWFHKPTSTFSNPFTQHLQQEVNNYKWRKKDEEGDINLNKNGSNWKGLHDGHQIKTPIWPWRLRGEAIRTSGGGARQGRAPMVQLARSRSTSLSLSLGLGSKMR